jgi:hypothetical protein
LAASLSGTAALVDEGVWAVTGASDLPQPAIAQMPQMAAIIFKDEFKLVSWFVFDVLVSVTLFWFGGYWEFGGVA